MKETLQNNPNIEKVYFAKDGSYSFNCYEDGDKRYTRVTSVFGKQRTFSPEHEVVEVKTRQQLLGLDAPKVADQVEGGPDKSKAKNGKK